MAVRRAGKAGRFNEHGTADPADLNDCAVGGPRAGA